MTTADQPATNHATNLTDFLATYMANPRHRPTPEDSTLQGAADRMSIHTAPFTHGVIDDFLPSKLYDDVVAAWPGHGVLTAVSLPGNGHYVGSRHAHLLENEDGRSSDTLTGHPWDTVRSALRSAALLSSLAERFSATLEHNLAALPTPTDARTATFKLWANQDEGKSEALGAHVDDLRKILTIVVYLQLSGDTDADSARRWGTALYDGERARTAPMAFSANSSHTPVAHVEFAANRAFVMPNAASALHGVAGGQDGVTRATLMCGYWLSTDPSDPS